jgi:AmmeMemoRadiSam system protein B
MTARPVDGAGVVCRCPSATLGGEPGVEVGRAAGGRGWLLLPRRRRRARRARGHPSEAGTATASEGSVGPAPVALVAPHVGYVYSGPVAASAYDWLRDRPVRRVAVLGPAHFVPLTGVAVPAAAAFATPIGEVPVEVHTCAALVERQECVTVDDRPHRPEHSIEVQLPFLRRVLAHGWTCVPLVVGATAPEQVADVLDSLCVDGDTLPRNPALR